MKYQIKGTLRPAMYYSVVDKCMYATTGDNRIKVDMDTKLDDIEWIRSDVYIKIMNSPKEEVSPKKKTWNIKGSKNNSYKVTFDGKYKCNCPGFSFRKTCKHIETVKGGQK